MMTTEVGRFILCACATLSVLLNACTAAPTTRAELPEISPNIRLSEEDVGRVVSAMAREVMQVVNEKVNKFVQQPKDFGYGLDGLAEGAAYKRGKIACQTAWCNNSRLAHNLIGLDTPTDTGVGTPGRKRRDTS